MSTSRQKRVPLAGAAMSAQPTTSPIASSVLNTVKRNEGCIPRCAAQPSTP